MNETSAAAEHNPAPEGTATTGLNEPGPQMLLTKPKPVQLARVGKHRAGRTLPLTKEERRKRDRLARRLTQLGKRIHLDQKALARGMEDA